MVLTAVSSVGLQPSVRLVLAVGALARASVHWYCTCYHRVWDGELTLDLVAWLWKEAQSGILTDVTNTKECFAVSLASWPAAVRRVWAGFHLWRL